MLYEGGLLLGAACGGEGKRGLAGGVKAEAHSGRGSTRGETDAEEAIAATLMPFIRVD